MKVLNINSYYFSSSVHKQMRQAILKKGVNTTTYVPLAKEYVERGECQNEDERVDSVECYNHKDRYIFHLKHRKILKDITPRYNFQKFDCIHAHSLFSNGYIALQIKKKYKVPYIVTVRDTDLNTFFKHMIHLRKLGINILKEAEKIIFLSKPYRETLITQYVPKDLEQTIFDKSEIIPSGIDDFWFQHLGTPKALSEYKELKLLQVGVVSKRKNLLTTVKAIEILEKKGYNVTFTVVGKVKDESIYQALKMYSFVTYIPPKLQEDLKEIYRSHDIFVMPSITETFGLVYAEAMSQGLPIIYSKNQGFDGQFDEGVVGYSVSPKSPEEITNRILDISNNFEVISNRCIGYVVKFNWFSISQEYIEEYSQIIDGIDYKRRLLTT